MLLNRVSKIFSTITIQSSIGLKVLSFTAALICLSLGPAAAADLIAVLSSDASSQFSGYRLYYKTGSPGAPYDGIGADQGSSPIDIPKSAIGDQANGEFTLTGLQEGKEYYFVATIYDKYGNESPFSNEVLKTTPTAPENQAPLAEAGADQSVGAGTAVMLDGSGSRDPDGGISVYRWTQTGGQAVVLDNENTSTASFSAPDITSITTLTFQLQVSDQQGLSAMDTCMVTVIPETSGNAGGDGNPPEGNLGSGAAGIQMIVDDADAAFSMVGAWSVSDKAVGYFGSGYAYARAGNGASAATFTFEIPADGTYEISAQWPAHDSRAPDAPFTLVNNGTVVDTIRVNQQIDGGRFNLLSGPASMEAGNYVLNAGVLEVVLSDDAAGKVAADAVKVTEIEPVVTDTPVDSGASTITDNADAAFSTAGAWSVSNKAVGFYGTDYAYAYAGNGSSTATFTFEIPADGKYEISAQWPAHDSRAPDAPFTLVNNGVVVDTIRVNQQIDGGRFNLLSGPASTGAGIYVLNAGVLEVVLSNDAAGKVAADAVQVVDLGPVISIATDNADAAFSTAGAWSISNKAVGFYGTDYAYAYAGDGSSAATFTFEIPADGNYEISAQWPAHDSRAPDAPFTLVNNGTVVDTIRVNQQIDGGRFNLLSGPASMDGGVYALNAGVLEVVLSNDAAGKVAADAVQVDEVLFY